jgi:hypothetical protein
MDRNQAKEILLGYRPGGEDAVDPEIVQALALVDRDAELARWFEQQQRTDAAIRARVRETPVPADLKQRILAEQKVVRVDFGWPRPAQLAAAAAVVVLGVIGLWVYRDRTVNGLSGYRTAMVQYVATGYNMYIKASSFDELRQVLAQRSWPTDFAVPDSLRNVTVIGGSAYQWNGHKVDLACMMADNRGLWLFVIEKTAVRNAPATAAPQIETVDPMATAVWSQDGNTYLLVVQGDQKALEKYLPSVGS